jgi:hypothetical protein
MDHSSKPASRIPRLSSSRLPLPLVRGPSMSFARLEASGSDPQAVKARCRVPTIGLASSGGANETTEALSDAANLQPKPPKERRKPKPSLSDRTVETLSQIPPSPLSNRRKSSFFNTDMASSMRPPLRPASAMSKKGSRPSSPTKQSPAPRPPKLCKTKSEVELMCARCSMTQPSEPRAGVSVCKEANCARKPTAVRSELVQDYESFRSTPTMPSIGPFHQKLSSSNSQAKRPATRWQPVAAINSVNTIGSPRKASAISTPTTASPSSHQSRRS